MQERWRSRNLTRLFRLINVMKLSVNVNWLTGPSDPDQIGAKQLHAMADDLGVRATVVLKAAVSLSEQLHQTMPDVVTRFADIWGTSSVLERIPIIVRKQIRRLKTMLHG